MQLKIVDKIFDTKGTHESFKDDVRVGCID